MIENNNYINQLEDNDYINQLVNRAIIDSIKSTIIYYLNPNYSFYYVDINNIETIYRLYYDGYDLSTEPDYLKFHELATTAVNELIDEGYYLDVDLSIPKIIPKLINKNKSRRRGRKAHI